MRLVYSSPVGAAVYHAKNLLEAEGIRCQVHGEHLASTLMFPGVWVELYVERDGDLARAGAILERALGDGPPPGQDAAKACPACAAEIEGPFANCWRCGAELDGNGPGG